MENKMPDNVPYIVHDDAMVRNERLVRRLVYIIIAIALMLFATNAMWLYVWNSYDVCSYEQDGEGYNNINTGVLTQGDVFNESTDDDSPKKAKDKGQGDAD